MKIVLVQQFASPSFGILAIMTYLRHHGIDCEVIVWSLEKEPSEAVYELKPDLVGISLMSTEHLWMVEAVKKLRQKLPTTKIIVGGIHAVIYPEEILAVQGVDLVCNSDGENVLVETCRALDEGKSDLSLIKGLAYKDENGVARSTGRADFYNYSSDIIEDRTPYFTRYPVMAKDTVPRFIASRGCPYNCSFCYNGQIQNIFKDSHNKYLRYKDPDNLIREISNIRRKHPVESIFFVDDLFSANKKWLAHFLDIYKKEIGYPFMCTTRANLMTEELAKMLAGAGCRTISFGVETGNEVIREKILNKKISDRQLIECGQIARKYGMQVQTSNMFCLPEETLEDAYKTIELNQKAGTQQPFCSLFLPFPNTELTNYCIEKGYLKADYTFKDMPKSFLKESVLSLKDKEKIVNLQHLAYFFIRYPWLYKNFRWVVRFRILKPLFFILYLLSSFLRHKEERGRSYISTFFYAWLFRKTI
ncbi:MAG: radical SAM protein [Deltaproteobacteria bacterium]|nr:radical SAM protein [Deltaproteobacteria bacterium]